MTSSAPSLTQLDCDISMAYIALGVARSAFARSPNSENAKVVEDAERAVDRLLDDRLRTQAAA